MESLAQGPMYAKVAQGGLSLPLSGHFDKHQLAPENNSKINTVKTAVLMSIVAAIFAYFIYYFDQRVTQVDTIVPTVTSDMFSYCTALGLYQRSDSSPNVAGVSFTINRQYFPTLGACQTAVKNNMVQTSKWSRDTTSVPGFAGPFIYQAGFFSPTWEGTIGLAANKAAAQETFLAIDGNYSAAGYNLDTLCQLSTEPSPNPAIPNWAALKSHFAMNASLDWSLPSLSTTVQVIGEVYSDGTTPFQQRLRSIRFAVAEPQTQGGMAFTSLYKCNLSASANVPLLPVPLEAFFADPRYTVKGNNMEVSPFYPYTQFLAKVSQWVGNLNSNILPTLACDKLIDETAPFRCIFEKKTHNTLEVISLSFSLATTSVPFAVFLINLIGTILSFCFCNQSGKDDIPLSTRSSSQIAI